MRLSIPTAIAVAFTSMCSSAVAEETEVKGVNPADILSRADVIVKIVNLPVGESASLVAKYDKRLAPGLGVNFELPLVTRVSAGPFKATGVGDLFARMRYVRPLSQRVVALVSVEAVAPTAGNGVGSGKWQLNPGAGFVYLWSQRSFTAVIYKHSFSLAGDDKRPAISVNQARLLQTFVLDKGWYVTVDGKHEWQTIGRNEDWTTGEFEVGRQLSPRVAASARIGKTFGDRKNDGALELNVRTFF